jgi:hypothetical protein
MEISISKGQGTRPVSVIQLRGALDGESYQDFINESQKLYDFRNTRPFGGHE